MAKSPEPPEPESVDVNEVGFITPIFGPVPNTIWCGDNSQSEDVLRDCYMQFVGYTGTTCSQATLISPGRLEYARPGTGFPDEQFEAEIFGGGDNEQILNDPNNILPRTSAVTPISVLLPEMQQPDADFSYDVTAIIQELLTRPNWAPGGFLALRVEFNTVHPDPGFLDIIFAQTFYVNPQGAAVETMHLEIIP